jgi:hypothetical protein
LLGRSEPFSCCPGKKAGAEAKKGWEIPAKSPLFDSAKRRGDRGIAGRKRRKPAPGKEEPPPSFCGANAFLAGHGPIGPREFSLFAEATENKNFSEIILLSFSSKPAMISIS